MARNLRIALILFAIVAVWVASGMIGGDDTNANNAENGMAENAQSVSNPTVQVSSIPAGHYTRNIDLTGRSEPMQTVHLAAQTAGRITKLRVDRGDKVVKGEMVIELDIADRSSKLAAAKADVAAAQVSAKTARELFEEGFVAETRLAEAEAVLSAAQQSLAQIEQDIAYTVIKSPISGKVEDRLVDIGDYVKVGDPVLQLIGQKDFLIVAYAAQQERDELKVGQLAQAQLANGTKVTGKIRFIATNAQSDTKTYRVEILVDKQVIPTGMTADVTLPIEDIIAHKIPHDALVLADDGNVGVMLAQKENEQTKAIFHPVEILSDAPNGVWVGGLSEDEKSINLITRGQAAIRSGATVNIKDDHASN